MQLQPNDPGFGYLAKSVMGLLAKPRTKDAIRELISLLAPIWDYYIRFYLYKYGIYDNHEERHDYYSEIFCNCVDLLQDVKHVGNNFNRIKRYFNKSVNGWIYNKVFKKKKKDIELTKDDLTILLHPDPRNEYEEINYAIDMQTIKEHVDKELDFYFEMYGTMYGDVVYRKKNLYGKRFRDAVLTYYTNTGILLRAIDFFENKFGRIFEEHVEHKIEFGVRA